MTSPAVVRKSDLMRAAKVANETGCKIEIRSGGSVTIVYPEDTKDRIHPNKQSIDFTRPVL